MRRASLIAVGVYFALAAIPYWSYWHAGGTMMAGKGGDPATDAWFLAWVPYALGHGHNLLVTNWGNYPVGVNAITGIGMPLLGLLGAPVTVLSNAFVTTTLFFTLAFPLSAASGYVFVRQWVGWWPAAFVGGLLYGFSPYLVEHGSSHLNLVFVPLPPLILLVLSKVASGHAWWPWGVVLGVLCVAQFLISPEVLASTVVVGCAGLCVAAVAGGRSAWPVARERWRAVLGCLGVATLFAGIWLAYPLWLLVAGPGHVTGAVQNTSLYRGNLLAPVIPGSDMYFRTTASARLADTFSGGSENGLYLGVPLLIILLAGAVALWRRRPVMRIVAVVTVVAFVLSLGSRLVVGHHVVARVPLPEAVFTRIPLLESTIAARYSLYVMLGAAVMLAMIIEAVHEGLRAGVFAVLVPAGLAVVALVPLLPSWPYWLNVTQVPQYFTVGSVASGSVASVSGGAVSEGAASGGAASVSGGAASGGAASGGAASRGAASRGAASGGAGRIPQASVAVTFPFPLLRDAYPMLWQVAAGMRYKSPGGRFVAPLSLPIGQNVEGVFSYLSAGHQVARTPALRRQLTGQMQAWHVRTVLVEAGGSERVLSFFDWLLGRPPDQTVGGISAWYGLPAR